MLEWITAVGAAAAVSVLAWRLGALRPTGAIAATVVGAVVLALAGWGAAFTLVFFFVSSSALSALPGSRERSRRGARQVFANGSVAAIAAALFSNFPTAHLIFLGSLAAATADTWATEIGIRLGRAPRSILTFRRQTPGASGAVSIPGSLAAAAGALAVAVIGSQLISIVADRATLVVAIAGVLGAFLDSLLGAGPQAVYRCPRCGATPEVARHDGCEARASRASGVPGLDNDLVNWVATLAGGGIAVALAYALS